MWTFPKLHVSIFGMLMFGILQGTCGVLADTVKVLKVGGSLDLPFQYPMDSVLLVQWKFNGTLFAEYRKAESYELWQSQFSGRLKKGNDSVRVTVEDLQYQDSGRFLVSGLSIPQFPTLIIKVNIQSPITVVQIEKSQTWSVSTNSCDVDVRCKALGAESISYLWSGYKTEREDHLQFNLSTEEGIVTLNCTAANNVSSSSATETLSCATKQDNTGTIMFSSSVLKLICSLGAAFSFLLVTIILAVKCYRVRGHQDHQQAAAVTEELV